MGLFLKIGSPAFIEDLPINETAWEHEHNSMDYINKLYDQAAYNTWIAAGIYVLVLIFSFTQHRLNIRANYGIA